MAVERVSGDVRFRDLANELSDAAHKAMERGLSPDEVCSVMVRIAADYWMVNYDPKTVFALTEIIEAAYRAPSLGNSEAGNG